MELPNRHQLDAEAAHALTQISGRHRDEAIRLMGQPPNIDNIPEATWKKWRDELDAELATIALLIFFQSSMFHGASEDAALQSARLWAPGYARETSRQVMQTTYNRLDTISDRFQSSLSLGEDIEDEVAEAVNRVFGRERMANLALDVVTVGQTQGAENTIANKYGLSDEDWWQTNPGLSQSGPCKTCSQLHGQPRSVWQLKYPSGPGPEVHPGCVCEIRYVFLDNAENN